MIDGETKLAELDRTEQNRALVRRFVSESLLPGRLDDPDSFFRDGELIQHSPAYGDGVDAFRMELKRWGSDCKLRYERVHKILGQGNLFLAMSEGVLNDKPAAFYDLYRLSQRMHRGAFGNLRRRSRHVRSGRTRTESFEEKRWCVEESFVTNL